jgi:hypothetical protein
MGSKSSHERLTMHVKECRDLIVVTRLKVQQAPTMDQRATASRGLVDAAAGGLVSLATSAVNSMIENTKKKYTSTYNFGLTDVYFYDQISNEGPFDPAGMQFAGFELLRTFRDKKRNGVEDTALVAEFEVDTTHAEEIINNSVFRLKVKRFEVHYAKVKVPPNGRRLNLDITVGFQTSYVNDQGVIFDSVTLGKCYLMLRNAPLDPLDTGYAAYYRRLEGQLLKGKSFIVPRSFGYHREASGETRSGYSQGLYSINVTVTESSKERFVDKLILENAPSLINQGKSAMPSLEKKK